MAKELGVRPSLGGIHPNQGTRNALLHLGQETYLELLAIDNSNKAVQPPRWMGIDLITKPTITRWALKSSDLMEDRAIVKKYDPQMSTIQQGQRQTNSGALLTWQILQPLADPVIELVPFMVDWGSSPHPTDTLESGCRLQSVQLFHPGADRVQKIINELDIQMIIQQSDKEKIRVSIQGRNGRILAI